MKEAGLTRQRVRACAIGVIAIVVCFLAYGGTYQHPPFDPSVHLVLGEDYPYVVRFSRDDFNGENASGVLVAPYWVLTAAHVAAPDSPVLPPTKVNFVAQDGTLYERDIDLSWMVAHPDWLAAAGNPCRRYLGCDIAVVRLQIPMDSGLIAPVARYTGTDEQYHVATIVGFGLHGTGLDGWDPNSSDHLRRSGRNVIDEYGDTLPGSITQDDPDGCHNWASHLLVADFDNPDDPNDSKIGETTPNALEFHQAPGDSGGGWFIGIEGERQLTGISAFEHAPDQPPPGGFYGELSVATRVSSHNSWIDSYVQDEKRWTNPVSGMWDIDDNWDYAAPREYQAAVFDVAGAYTVTMPSTATTAQLRVEGGSDVALDGTFSYTITDLAALSDAGVIHLDAGATVDAGELRVGEYGVGTVSQSGGELHVTGDLYLGMTAGAVGTYHLMDGSLTVDGSVHGRLAGTDDFILDAPAGTLDVTGDIEAHNLIVGQDAYVGVISTFDLTHGNVTCDNLTIAIDGQGQVTQIGGDVHVAHTLTLGLGTAGDGTYNLAGGTLYVDTINIAPFGAGEFNWTAGDLQPYSADVVTVNVCMPAGVFNYTDPLPDHVMVVPLCDCNGNGTPDSEDLANCDGSAWCSDCNTNGVIDECDISLGISTDINGNGVPDECEEDCNGNGNPDDYDLATCDGFPWCSDCNGNGIIDECDISSGTSQDVNDNEVPDDCEDDCNGNGIPDDYDLANCDGSPWCADCNGNGFLDECDLSPADPDTDGWISADCNGNDVPDECEHATYILCVSGPDMPVEVECLGSDLDGDTDVDLQDFALFQSNCAQPYQARPSGMVFVPGGVFQMGDPWNEGDTDERPVHTVHVSAYCIDTFEVTNEQYAEALNWALDWGSLITVDEGVVREYGDTTQYCRTAGASFSSHLTWDGDAFGVVVGKEQLPVVQVSWYGAAAYCNWRSVMEGKAACYEVVDWGCDFNANGYRLPTEAEWEKAAGWDADQERHYRFGEGTDGCGYNCLNGQRANYAVSGDPYEAGATPYSTPIGFYDGELHYREDFEWPGGQASYQSEDARSYYGCYNMTGNVRELCNDWYSSTYYSSPSGSDPTGPETGSLRVRRGGSWADGVGIRCRAASREGTQPFNMDSATGFRRALRTP